jgi:hypothetical protein
MSVRVRYIVQAAVSSTSAEERDLGNVNWQIVTDQEAKGGTWKTKLPAGSSNVQLQIDNISTIQLIIVRVLPSDPNNPPGYINLTKNSPTGEVILVKPLGDAQEAHMLLSTDSVTSLYASNPGAYDLDVTVVAAGV